MRSSCHTHTAAYIDNIVTDSVDEAAFRTVPEVGAAPDMIADDLPVNMDYLDESFGAAAGLRELTEDDMDEFDATYTPDIDYDDPSIISRVGGETIRILEPEGLDIVENHFNTLPAITEELPQYVVVVLGVLFVFTC